MVVEKRHGSVLDVSLINRSHFSSLLVVLKISRLTYYLDGGSTYPATNDIGIYSEISVKLYEMATNDLRAYGGSICLLN